MAVTAVPLAGQAADPNDALRLPSPTYPTAAAELRAGRADAALDALDREARSAGAETPPLEQAILRAALLARAGRPGEAEDAWREVIDAAVFMRTFARGALVESLAGRGAPAEAEPILDQLIAADAARHRDLLLRVADAHLEAGTPERAAEHYRRVLRVSGRGQEADAARQGLAAALEAAGDATGALAALREAQLRHRTGDAFVGRAPRIGTAGRRRRRGAPAVQRRPVPDARAAAAARRPLHSRAAPDRRVGRRTSRRGGFGPSRAGTRDDAVRPARQRRGRGRLQGLCRAASGQPAAAGRAPDRLPAGRAHGRQAARAPPWTRPVGRPCGRRNHRPAPRRPRCCSARTWWPSATSRVGWSCTAGCSNR